MHFSVCVAAFLEPELDRVLRADQAVSDEMENLLVKSGNLGAFEGRTGAIAIIYLPVVC